MVQEHQTAHPYPPLFGSEMLANPYPVYHQLHVTDPVHWEEPLRAWILTRYADVLAALRDPRLSAQRVAAFAERKQLGRAELTPIFQAYSQMMLYTDAPDHTRLRGLVNKAFTPRRVEGLRPHIQAIVDQLLDAVQAAGQLDVIQDLAYPLPTIVIAELLGLPPEDRDRLKQWSDAGAAFLGNVAPTPEQTQQALQSHFELSAYFRSAATHRRAHPRNDLLSALITAEEQEAMLSETELVANCGLLLAAGHETTTNLIGNGLLALLRHPEQRLLLQEDPALITSAVEELLRYDSPVQLVTRMAREDLTLAGQRIRQGQFIILVLGAANRDPAQFSQPDQLDLRRPEKEQRHLAFGHGPHYCLGAPLARLEGQIAIGTLLQRLPTLRLTTEVVEWRENFTFRGLKALPIVF
jgi:cytochrome P450